jgi:hypothetical protein
MQDTEKANRISWDDKFQQLLWQLQDYQEAKDHPQAQVVNMEVEDLWVAPHADPPLVLILQVVLNNGSNP